MKLSNYKRINITLPDQTLRLIDKVTRPGDRSHLIDDAIRYYIDELSRNQIRKQLKERAMMRAERDLSIAKDWFPLEDELWDKK